MEATNRRAVEALLSPERTRDAATDRRVATIVADVRRNGDRALLRYAKTLDRLNAPVEVSGMKCATGLPRSRGRFAPRSMPRRVTFEQSPGVRFRARWRVGVTSGVSVEQRVIRLDCVGCCVPGGRYPLPSSLLMTAIPPGCCRREGKSGCMSASRAGRGWPPHSGRSVSAVQAWWCSRDPALAYGTESVPRVDKIVGTRQPLGGSREGTRRLGLRYRLLRGTERDPPGVLEGEARHGSQQI